MGNFGSMTGWTWLFWLLLIVGTVLLVILAVRAFSGGITRPGNGRGPGPIPPGAVGGTTARRILEERYARGDLSTEEYRERLEVLGGDT